MIKYSCSPIHFYNELSLDRSMCLEDWFEIAVDLELNGTEIHQNFLENLDKGYLAQVTEALSRYKLEVSQLICSTDFTNPDDEARETEVRKLKQLIDAARLIGADYLRITTGQVYPEIPFDQSIAWVVESFRECLHYAHQRGVFLTYENHYRDLSWDRPDFSMKHDVYIEIIPHLFNY